MFDIHEYEEDVEEDVSVPEGVQCMRLESNDEYIFDVSCDLLSESTVLGTMLKDLNVDEGKEGSGGVLNEEPMKLPFTGYEIHRMLVFLTNKVEEAASPAPESQEAEDLISIFRIGNYLDMTELKKKAVLAVGKIIASAPTIEDLRKRLRIRGNFTAREERQMRDEGLLPECKASRSASAPSSPQRAQTP